jgi:hypothetical protein
MLNRAAIEQREASGMPVLLRRASPHGHESFSHKCRRVHNRTLMLRRYGVRCAMRGLKWRR